MAEKSFPFNSVNKDRLYKAEEFAEYFAQLIGTGVIYASAESLKVRAAGSMDITLSAGGAFIEGRGYINNAAKTFTLDTADGALNRIDRLVIRCDYSERTISGQIKKGSYSASPTAQSLQRDADAYEIGIADIYVAKGVISISQSNITDLRLNTDLCGIVTALIQQADTTELYNQFEEYFTEFKQQYIASVEDWTDTKESSFKEWETAQKASVIEWFDSLKDIIDENVAGHLQNEIEAAAKDTFNRYYGLVAQETEYMPDGSIVTTNSEAVITTVFGKNEDGYKTITETIKPTAEQGTYVKVTTIIPATDTENKKISEAYSSEL
jgi:hypothetical protein